MIRRILVGIGGTSFTPIAVRYSVELAQSHEAELHGVTVIDRRRLGAFVEGAGDAMSILHESRRLDSVEKRQEKAIAEFESMSNNAGVRHKVLRESGDPFAKMISQARYYDLMIFGLRSLFDCDTFETDGSEVLTRFVAKGVRPVLAVSQEYRPIRRVLIAYSGSMESAKAFKRFMHMQLWPDLSIKVVTFEHRPEIANALLTDVADYCRAYGCDPEIEHLPGTARDELLKHATNWNADLIVLGNSAKQLWLKKLLGETAMHVIKNANIPLFLSQ